MNSKELEKYFGKLILDKRKEKNITQEQLAELVGISVTYLRSIEYGKYSATWKIWLKICKVLHLDINEIMNEVQIDNDYIHF
ncbi:MAG: helix-turn-helix transcriptional regulator [Oscillospiraceae bacterium]|nr:helix-turn-helix transcriptional regulator [Oscillospiraceae bacterium]